MEESTRIPKFTVDRLIGFSDGVFAIVVTILVLGIDIPTEHSFSEAGLKAFFQEMQISLLAYVISFLLGIVYWLQHYFIFHFVKYNTNRLIWLNAFFLMSATLLPFATKVKTLYEYEFSAILLYSIVQFIISGSLLILWHYVRKQEDILETTIPPIMAKNFTFLLLTMPVVCIAAVLISTFNVHIGTVLFFIVPLINILVYWKRKIYL